MQPQQVVEESLPNGVHDALPGPFQHGNLKKVGNKPQRHDQQENPCQDAEPAQALVDGQAFVDNISVDADPDEIGHQQRGGADDQGKHDGQHNPIAVRIGEAQNPPPQADIPDVPELVVFRQMTMSMDHDVTNYIFSPLRRALCCR